MFKPKSLLIRSTFFAGASLVFALVYMVRPDIFYAPLYLFAPFLAVLLVAQAFIAGRFDRRFAFLLEDRQVNTYLARVGVLAIIFGCTFLLLLVTRITF